MNEWFAQKQKYNWVGRNMNICMYVYTGMYVCAGMYACMQISTEYSTFSESVLQKSAASLTSFSKHFFHLTNSRTQALWGPGCYSYFWQSMYRYVGTARFIAHLLLLWLIKSKNMIWRTTMQHLSISTFSTHHKNIAVYDGQTMLLLKSLALGTW